MFPANLLSAFQIRNGPCDLPDFQKGSGIQRICVIQHSETRLCFLIKPDKLLRRPAVKLTVPLNVRSPETFLLNPPGALHLLPHLRRGYRCAAGQFPVPYIFQRDMQIDPIHNRARNSASVTLNFTGCASAFMLFVSVVSAPARIGGRHQEKIRGKHKPLRQPRDLDFSVLQRLPQHIDCSPIKFPEFIQE